MPQVVIVSSLGPQGPVGPQGLQGLTGSMAESNSGSFAITGSLTVSGSSTFTNIGPAVFSGSSNFTSLTASSALISGDVTVLGTASINTLIVNQTQLSTGSNQLGDAADDTQTLYGTVVIPTGSLTVSGSTLTSGSLTVDGNIGLTGDIIQQDVNLDMKISGAQTGRAVRLVTSSTGLRLQALGSTTSNFTLSTTVSSSETARVTILEGGNVGIGTVTPSYTLDISGSLRVGTPTATPHLIFARASNNYITTPVGGALLFNLNNAAVENASIVGIYSTGLKIGTGFSSPSAVAHVRGTGATSATTALLVQNSNASASLTVLDNGYVGIGSTTPLRQLYVAGDLEVTNGIYGDSTDHTFYTIASGSYHHRFYTRTSGGTSLERFTIQGGADTGSAYFQNTNVGIGTTTPESISNTTTLTVNGANGGGAVSFQVGGVRTGLVNGNDNYLTLQSYASRALSLGYNGSNTLVVNTSNNVGIGTTAPSAKLDVIGTGVFGSMTASRGNYSNGLSLQNNAGQATSLFLWQAGIGSGHFGFPSGSSNLYIVNSYNTGLITEPNYIVLSNTGNVGIGTTAPTARLHVVGTGSTSATAAFLVRNSNLSASMVVKDDGFVGIGTVSPTGKVHITPYPSYYTLVVGRSNGYSSIKASTDDALSTTLALDSAGGATILNHYVSDNVWLVTGGGNAGVGTNAPTARLHAKGTGTTSATTAFRVENSNTSASMVVLDNGNVGINTANPLEALDVTGNFNTTGFIYRTGITGKRLFLYTSGNNEILSLYDNSGTTKVELRTSGSSYFTSGNVGIGTTAPTANLVVSSGSAPTLKLENTANIGTTGWVGTTISSLEFSTTDPSAPGTYARISAVGGSGSAGGGLEGDLVFSTTPLNTPNSITERVRINSIGNVGIGTTTPGSLLTVAGAVSASSFNANFAVVSTRASKADFYGFTGPTLSYYNGVSVVPALTVNSTGNITINTTTDSGAKLAVRGAGSTSATTAFRVENANASGSMIILDNGYVGIGTAAPSYSLDVYGSYHQYQVQGLLARYDISSANANQNRGVWDFYTNVATAADFFGRFGFKFEGGVSDSFKQYQLHIGDSVNPKFVVDGAGRVAIGTITPSASLHISGSSGSVLLEVDSNSSQNILYVSGSGNVGIGTNAPTQKLDVDGAILVRAGNAVYFRDTTSYIYEGSGLNIVSGATRNIRLNAGGTDRFFVSSSGFVGIGTTTPIDLLNIRLNQNGTTQMRVENSNNDANSRASIAVGSAGDALTIARYLSNYVNSSWANRGGILTDSGLTNGFFFRTATGSISFEPVSIERMRITSEGNVGIGTSTPTTTLDIQSTSTGSIRISGSAGSQITFVRPTAGLTGFVRYTSTQMDIGTVGSDGLNLFTSNTSRVSIQTNGDVLIGAGSVPAGRLEVKGSGTTSSTISLRVGNSTPAPSLVITDDLTSRFYGNVGIGALPTSGSLHISGAASTSSAAVYIYKSGSTTLDIQGSQGQLFSVTDALSGSLMSVNDISGLPILEVFSDDRVVMGSFSQPALLVTGSAVRFPATASATPTYTGSEGQVVFGVVGGNAFIYAWLGGRWRSGSLA